MKYCIYGEEDGYYQCGAKQRYCCYRDEVKVHTFSHGRKEVSGKRKKL